MSHFLDVSAFTPHGFCLAWQPGLIWLTAASNLLIAAAYFSIPAALAALLIRRPGFEYASVLFLFAAFILACGTTHVFEAVTLWVPLYWISGITDAVTAALSIVTAILLWPLLPKFIALPSPTYLQKQNLRLQAAEAATAQANRWLIMSEQLAHVGHWRHTRGDPVIILSDELFRIFGIKNINGTVSSSTIGRAWHEEDRDIFRNAMSVALREKSGFDISVRLVRPSGEIRHVQVRGEVQLDSDGQPISMFGICIDRTQQAHVERELDHARANAEAARDIVEKLALQDSLTGLANRRLFDQALDAEYQRARRIGNHLSLIMLDVDHFKQFNDELGHPAGDDCLRAIATVISAPLHRPGDLAARYGGEEFAVILPGTDLASARDMAWKIVASVRDLGIGHASNPRRTVTISAGIASMTPAAPCSNAVQLLEWADEALYTAKTNGRDRAHAHPTRRPGQAASMHVAQPVPLTDGKVVQIGSARVRRWSPSHVLRSDTFGSAPDSGFDLAAVLDSFPFPVLLTDATRREHPVACVNAAFCALTGYRPQDVIGRSYKLLYGADADPEILSQLDRAVKNGVALHREAVGQQRKNGECFQSDIFLAPLKDAAGALFGTMITQHERTCGRQDILPANPAEPAARLAKIADPQPASNPANFHLPSATKRERQTVILQRSLKRGSIEAQFHLVYHPVVEVGTGRIVGTEALLRWHHPQLGVQRPDKFIPLAEASGLIVPLGAWVFRTALLELKDWHASGSPGIRIAVNVSSVQLREPGFIAMIDDVLAETGVDPSFVDLELTESVMIEANPATLAVLDALKSRSFNLALDDFGTGYSSFRCLQDLPIDQIKIDQTFVRRLTHDTGEDAIVRAMLSVTERLGVGVIAEGIETAEQRDFLCREGCMLGQGYFFSLPVQADTFRTLLASGANLPLPASVAAGTQAYSRTG
jgi:diguanylate cyclase (GGDEF)-like protein/PAS domain S-box-containing protein